LINGAGGGVGTFAVQIAKSLGAEVTGVDLGEKLDLVRSVGADHVIDYRQEDFTWGTIRYDRIIDVAAHRSILDYRRILTPSGVYVVIGGSTRPIIQTATVGTWVSMPERKKMGVLVYTKPRAGDLNELRGLLAASMAVPVIDRVLPVSETAEALRYHGQGYVRGKVVISCV
jgi:NADPH:quinone reductase-like Zn-dependent oxidoreductase